MVVKLFISAAVLASAILGVLYVRLEKIDPATIPDEEAEASRVVRVVHSELDGIHRYVGEVKLGHSCYVLRQSISAADRGHVRIDLRSEDVSSKPDSICSRIVTRYPFDGIIEADSDADVQVTLDGADLPIRIVETAWQSSEGVLIDTHR